MVKSKWRSVTNTKAPDKNEVAAKAQYTLCDFRLLLDAESTKDGKSHSVSAPMTTIFRWFYQRGSCLTDSKERRLTNSIKLTRKEGEQYEYGKRADKLTGEGNTRCCDFYETKIIIHSYISKYTVLFNSCLQS